MPIYESTSTNHVTRSTIHIIAIYISCYWHILMNKYGCHIVNIGHVVLYQRGKICDGDEKLRFYRLHLAYWSNPHKNTVIIPVCHNCLWSSC